MLFALRMTILLWFTRRCEKIRIQQKTEPCPKGWAAGETSGRNLLKQTHGARPNTTPPEKKLTEAW